MISLTVRALALVGLLAAGLAPASHSEKADVQVVEVTAERFSFTPSEVRTKVGTTLEFRLRSDDTGHGFRILGTSINLRIPKRGKGVETVTFTPDKPGRYTFECSKLCGAGHSFMRGVIIVSE
jgi:cytochrome c oxidase subunit 2